MSIAEALEKLTRILRQAGIERPLLEAELLLSFHSGLDRVGLRLHESDSVEDEDSLLALARRRANHEPLEYIVGRAGFYSEEFIVHPGVLIPRPETELLVDAASALIERHSLRNIAEIGTGSAIVSVMLAKKHPQITIEASDISPKALENAKVNMERFDMSGRISLHHCSMLDDIDTKVDMIVSNPPYIARKEELPPEVSLYEPHEALYSSGEDGCDMLKAIVNLAIEREIPYVVCEMGYLQREPMRRFFEERAIGEYRFYRDLAGLDRGFELKVC
jgi:release factor glutamine methyltransferase